MPEVFLSSAMRQNLLSLQTTKKDMDKVNEQLTTGREVNAPTDGVLRFFSSENLSRRANSLDKLMNSLGQNKKVVEAAQNGLTSMRDFLDQAEALLRQSQEENDGMERQKNLADYNKLLNGAEQIARDSGYGGKNLLAGAGNDVMTNFNVELTSSHTVKAVQLTDIRQLGLNKNLSSGTNGTDTVAISANPISLQAKMVDIPGFAAGDVIEFVGVKQGDFYGSVEITDGMTVDQFITTISFSVPNVKASFSATTGSIDFEYASETAIRHNKEPNTALSGYELNHALGGGNGMVLGGSFAGNISASDNLNGLGTNSFVSGNSIDITVTDINGTARTTSFVYGVDGTTVRDLMSHMNNNADDFQMAINYDQACLWK